MLDSGVLGALWVDGSVLGVLLSCGVDVGVDAPPADVVEFGPVGTEFGEDGDGVCEVSVSGVVVLGVDAGGVPVGVPAGAGFVLFPPDGVCSLIGWLLCD